MRADVNNVGDLERVLHEEWRRIPMNTVREWIDSMRKRCRSVLRAQGGHGYIEDNQLVIYDMKNISRGCVVRR